MDEGLEAIDRNDMADALVSLGRAVNFFTTAKDEGIGRLLAAKKERAVVAITPIFRPEAGEECQVIKSNDHAGGYDNHFKLELYCLDPEAIIQYTVVTPGTKSRTHATMGAPVECPAGQLIDITAWGQGVDRSTQAVLVSELRESVYRSVLPKQGKKLFELQSWMQFKTRKVRNQTMKKFQQERAWVLEQGISRVLQQKPALVGSSTCISVNLHKIMKVASVGDEEEGAKRKASRMSNEEAEREAACSRIQEILLKQKPKLKEKRNADKAKADAEQAKVKVDRAKKAGKAKSAKSSVKTQGAAKKDQGADGQGADEEWVAVRVVFSVAIHESEELRKEIMGKDAALFDTEVGGLKKLPVEDIAVLLTQIQQRLSDPEQVSGEDQARERNRRLAASGGGGGGGGRVVATILEDPDAKKPFSQRFCECVRTLVDKAAKKALGEFKVEEKVKEKLICIGGARPPATAGFLHELAHCELAPKADIATIERDRLARDEREEAETKATVERHTPKSKSRTMKKKFSTVQTQGKKGLLAREAEQKAAKDALEAQKAEELRKQLGELRRVYQDRAKAAKMEHQRLKLEVWDTQSAFLADVFDVSSGRRASGVSFGRMKVGQSAASMQLKEGHNKKELEMVEEMAKEAAANEKKRFARYQTLTARKLQARYRGEVARKAMGKKKMMYHRKCCRVKLQALARGFIVRCRRWHRIRRDYERDLERRRREEADAEDAKKKKAKWAAKHDLAPRVDPAEWARRKAGKAGPGKGHGKGKGKGHHHGKGGKGHHGKGQGGGKGDAPGPPKEKAKQAPLTSELLVEQWAEWKATVAANPKKYSAGMPQTVADKMLLQVLEKGAKSKEANETLDATIVRLFFGLYGRGTPLSATKCMGFVAWLQIAIKERHEEHHALRLLFAEMLAMCDPPEGMMGLHTGCSGIIDLFAHMVVGKPKGRQYLAMTNLSEASVAMGNYATRRAWGDERQTELIAELGTIVVIDESRSNGGMDVNPDSHKWIDVKDLVLFVGRVDRSAK
jgi:hypothetical protein